MRSASHLAVQNVFRSLAVAWAILIFILSSQPVTLDQPLLFPGEDKIAHTVIYGILGYLIVLGLKGWESRITWTEIGVAALIVCCYGITDEYHQGFVPDRTPSIGDVVADGIGGLIGACLAGRRRW